MNDKEALINQDINLALKMFKELGYDNMKVLRRDYYAEYLDKGKTRNKKTHLQPKKKKRK